MANLVATKKDLLEVWLLRQGQMIRAATKVEHCLLPGIQHFSEKKKFGRKNHKTFLASNFLRYKIVS